MVFEMLARHSVGKRLGGSNPSYGGYATIAQMDRAVDYESTGFRFESEWQL